MYFFKGYELSNISIPNAMPSMTLSGLHAFCISLGLFSGKHSCNNNIRKQPSNRVQNEGDLNFNFLNVSVEEYLEIVNYFL